MVFANLFSARVLCADWHHATNSSSQFVEVFVRVLTRGILKRATANLILGGGSQVTK